MYPYLWWIEGQGLGPRARREGELHSTDELALVWLMIISVWKPLQKRGGLQCCYNASLTMGWYSAVRSPGL